MGISGEIAAVQRMTFRTQCASGPKYPMSKDSEVPMLRLEEMPANHRFAPGKEFERLLDSEEAAALLKIHPKTLQKMARKKEIAGVQIGKLWRFRASVLNEWLEQKVSG
jgi:excisionase family DNA binding protein